jgi:hypothetical protein
MVRNFMFVDKLSPYNACAIIKLSEMGGTYSTHKGDEKLMQNLRRKSRNDQINRGI